jgi:hypothetical protein
MYWAWRVARLSRRKIRIEYAWRNLLQNVLLRGRQGDGKLAFKCALEKYATKMGGVKELAKRVAVLQPST